MRAIAILAALAMVVGMFLPWLNPQISGTSFAPWDLVKELEPSVETVTKMAKDAPELLAFLATFAVAALFLVLAVFGMPIRSLAFLAGGGAVAMTAYAFLQLKGKAASLGLPIPSSENLADLVPKIPDYLGIGAMAWGGGSVILLLTALIGFPSRR